MRIGEVGVAKLSALGDHSFEMRAAKPGGVEIRAKQGRPAGVSIGKVGPAKRCTAKCRAAQIRRCQNRMAKIGTVKSTAQHLAA